MFKGITRTILIVCAMLVVAPALMMYGIGGSQWWQQMRLMSPFF
jgi:hypothetical protein